MNETQIYSRMEQMEAARQEFAAIWDAQIKDLPEYARRLGDNLFVAHQFCWKTFLIAKGLAKYHDATSPAANN